MSTVAMSSVVDVGPWLLLAMSILLVLLIPKLVRLVLNKSIPAAGDRDVCVKVRLLLWLRIEIDIKTPTPELAQDVNQQSGDPPAAEGVPPVRRVSP